MPNFRTILLPLVLGAFLTAGCQIAQNAAVLPPDGIPPAATPHAKPATPKVIFSSVYTKTDSKSCKPIGDSDEGPVICQGYKDYKVFVGEHGILPPIYIGRGITADIDDWEESGYTSFNPGSGGGELTIEWRLADGEAFACIVRSTYDKSLLDPDMKGTVNELIVRNLKGFAPIDITIDASKTQNANDEAHKRADAAFEKL